MGTISEMLKYKYAKLVEDRAANCRRYPAVASFYDAYIRAMNMDERVFGLYTYEAEAARYKEAYRSNLINSQD